MHVCFRLQTEPRTDFLVLWLVKKRGNGLKFTISTVVENNWHLYYLVMLFVMPMEMVILLAYLILSMMVVFVFSHARSCKW